MFAVCSCADVVDVEMEPKLLHEIGINAEIYALTVFETEIFVIRGKKSNVKVFDRTSFEFQRNVTVENVKEPRDIACCGRSNCLYIVEGTHFGQPREILKIDKNGNVLKMVWRGNDWRRLSITDEANLILAVCYKNTLLEITPDGKLVREITLDVPNPRHAVKLTGDRFVVSYDGISGGGICMVNSKGILMSSCDEAFCTSDFRPINLAVHIDGSLLVVDEDGGRIILLSSTLEYQREFISMKHGLRHPRRLFVDEPNGRLLVCDSNMAAGCILVFDIAG